MTKRIAEAMKLDLGALGGTPPDQKKYAEFLQSPAYDAIMENNLEDLRLFDYIAGL